MRQTTMAKPNELNRKWYLVDAEGKNLGRLASEVAQILRGKHKPIYTPHVDCGDYVIVINAEKAVITGDQKEKKFYYNYSGFPGGMGKRSTQVMREKYPIEWVERAIFGMLPHTKLGNKQRKKLFVYEGGNHPHTAQTPVELKL